MKVLAVNKEVFLAKSLCLGFYKHFYIAEEGVDNSYVAFVS